MKEKRYYGPIMVLELTKTETLVVGDKAPTSDDLGTVLVDRISNLRPSEKLTIERTE